MSHRTLRPALLLTLLLPFPALFAQAPIPPVDLTGSFLLEASNEHSTLDRATRILSRTIDLSLRNTSPTTVIAPLHLVIQTSDPSVVVAGAQGGPGQPPYGTWWFDLSAALPNGRLETGDALQRQLLFSSPATDKFTWQARVFGRLEATDGNRAPEIVSTPLTEAVDGLVYYYQAVAIDPEGDPVAYALDRGPGGMSLTHEGFLAWIAPASLAGTTHTVTLTAADPYHAPVPQQFTLRVLPFNRPPEFVSVPPRLLPLSEPYGYKPEALDPEGQPVTYELESHPEGMTIGPDGTINWQPGAPDLKSHPIVIRALDPAGASSIQEFPLLVYDDRLPLDLTQPSGEHVVAVGDTLRLPVEVNQDKAAITADPLPDGAALTPEEFVFTPAADQAGLHLVSVQAKLGELTDSNLLLVRVTRPNHPPVFIQIPAQRVTVGDPLSFIVEATDPDNDPILFGAPGLTLEGALFDPLLRRFSFTPREGQEGPHTVEFSAFDGTATVKMQVSLTVDPAPPPTGEPLNLVVDPPANPTFAISTTITGSIAGGAQPEPPPPALLITGLDPVSMRQGRTATVELTGYQTAFVQGEVSADFGEGIAVESLEVLSPTRLRVSLRADPLAPVGTRALTVTTPENVLPSAVAFLVEAGESTIAGQVIDPFLQGPLAGARVVLGGSNLSETTDADGRFLLTGAPAGARTLFITKANYELRRIDLAIATNQEIELDPAIELNALVRPPQPPGSLDPAATLASIVDRNIGSRNGGLDLESAMALVTDAMIVLGGTDAGVLDDNGNQLNPQLAGGYGMMTLTRDGVRRQAEALIKGDVTPLGDVLIALQLAFHWRGDVPGMFGMLDRFQQEVNAAWARPSDPANAMIIALFNDGTSLSTRPPVLTPETPLNNFQAFLLVTSFLVYNHHSLEMSIDQIFLEKGIDFENDYLVEVPTAAVEQTAALVEPAAPGMLARGAGLLFDALTPAAHAQGGTTLAEPNDFDRRRGVGNPNFQKIWRNVMAGALVEATYGAAKSLFYQLIIGSVVTFAIGSTGGLAGGVIAVGMQALAGAVWGATDVLLQKMMVGWYIGRIAAAMEPEPPVIDTSEVKDDELVIYFRRSTTETFNKARENNPPTGITSDTLTSINPALLHYTYQLYRFPNALTKDMADAEFVNVKVTIDEEDGSNFPTQGRPMGRLKFSVPLPLLKIGPNYLRIGTFQYIQKSDTDLVEGVPNYDQNNDGSLTPNEFPGTLAEFNAKDKDHNGQLDLTEFVRQAMPFDTRMGTTGIDPIATFLVPPAEFLSDAVDYGNKLEAHKQTVLDRVNEPIQLHKGDQAIQYSKQVSRLRQAEIGIDADMAQNKLNFETNNRRALDQLPELYDLSREHAGQSGDFNKPGTEAYAKSRQLIDGLPLTNPAVFDSDMAEHARLNNQVASLQDNQDVLKQSRTQVQQNYLKTKELIRNIRPNEIVEFDHFTIDDNGQPLKRTVRVQANPAGLEQLDELIHVEETKLRNVQTKIIQTGDNIQQNARRLQENLLGSASDTYHARRQTLAIEKQSTSGVRRSFERSRERAVNEVFKQRRQEPHSGDFLSESSKKRYGRLSKGMDVGGALIAQTDTLILLLNSIRVLSSDFSACHFYNNRTSSRGDFPPAIQTHPGYFGSVISVKDGPIDPRRNKVYDGFLTLRHPGEKDAAKTTSAGFPPIYLALDDENRLITINNNSTALYGGRIFAFEQTGRGFNFIRSLIGAINYYSQTIFFARPVEPAAMGIGPVFMGTTTGGATVPTQDLYVAAIDLMDGKNQLKRVPISLADLHPGYAEGGSVTHRIVGQIVSDSPEFKFTGPGDIKAGPNVFDADVTALNGTVYMSDEDSIWAIFTRPSSGVEEVQRIIQAPGRRFSGIDFDKSGDIYFADFANGTVNSLSHDHLRALVIGGETWGNDELTSYSWQVFRDIRGPGEIEVDDFSEHAGRSMYISTRDGISRRSFPIVGKYVNVPPKISIWRFGKVAEMLLVPEYRQYVLETSFEEITDRHAKVLVAESNSEGQNGMVDVSGLLAEAGFSILSGVN